MKRFFGLLIVLAFFCGCDDGDMEVESFDFSTVSSASCGDDNADETDFFVYKTSGNEALIIQLKRSIFEKRLTPVGSPKLVPITGTDVKVIYRLYNGPITGDDLCATITPSFPIVEEEWNATGGTMEIATSAVREIDEASGSNFITGFSNTITFRNIRFDKGNGNTQTNELLNFGSYVVDAIDPIDFTQGELRNCPGQPILFKYSGVQAITLSLSPSAFQTLFANQPTVDAPRTQVIDASNTFTYRVFASSFNQDSFCASQLPAVEELWNARPGVAGSSGIIEVTTTTLGDNFEHTITLKNVTVERLNQPDLSFSFGTSYVLGKFVTSN